MYSCVQLKARKLKLKDSFQLYGMHTSEYQIKIFEISSGSIGDLHEVCDGERTNEP